MACEAVASCDWGAVVVMIICYSLKLLEAMSWTQTGRLRSWGEQNDRRMIIGYQNSVYGKMSKASKEIAMAIEMKSPERQSRTYHGLSGRVRETSMELKENPRREKKPTEASIPTWNFRMLITPMEMKTLNWSSTYPWLLEDLLDGIVWCFIKSIPYGICLGSFVFLNVFETFFIC